MTFLKTSDGIKIYYQFVNKTSKKPPLVFVHGFAVNWTCFKKEINFFKKEGHPVLFFDLRGHGKSGKNSESKSYSFQRFSKDLQELLIENNIKRKIVLVSHSLGGMISLYYTASNSSKVDKLILIDSADKAPNQNKLMKKIQKNKLFRTTYTFLAMHYQKNVMKEEDLTEKEIHETPELFFVEQILSSNPKIMLKITDTIFSTSKLKTKKITCPTLIIGSEKDELFSKKEELQLSKKITKSLIKFFPGHHDIIIKEPQTISKEIKQFIYTKDEFFTK